MNIITKVILMCILFCNQTRASEETEFVKIFKSITLKDGRVLDRSSDVNTISSASTGLVSYAKIISAKRGYLDLAQTKNEVYNGFRETVSRNPSKNLGWLYHFTDLEGNPVKNSEVSTIDTAIFFFSFLKISEIVSDPIFQTEVRSYMNKIDLDIVFKNGYFKHGWIWVESEKHMIDIFWENSDECVILYRLFDKPFVPKYRIISFPLFVYYYPLCFFVDKDQIELLKQAVEFQKRKYNYIGVTACDDENGYQIGSPNVFSPLSIYAASKYSDLAKEELNKIPCNRLTGSFNERGWVSSDVIGIDYASCYIILFGD